MKSDTIINNLDITPKKDIVFKRIFGAKGNEKILKDFLESILNINIDSLTLDLSTELLPDFYYGKKSRVDVRARLSNGTEVNIEMQMNASDFSEERCLQYWAKIYSNTIKESEKYTSLRKTICIWILNDEIYKEFKDFDSKWQIMNSKYKTAGHFSNLEFHVIELSKFRNLDIMKPSKKDFWLWFIDHTNEELIKMACVSNEEIRKAREELNKIRANEELMDRIRLQELAEWDENTRIDNAMKKGLEDGEKKGSEKSKKEIALNLLKLNMPIEQISEATGLSKEEIEKLKLQPND